LLSALFRLSKPAIGQVTPRDHVAIIPVTSMILPGTAIHVQSSLALARESGAKLCIIELATPGGLIQSSQEIVQAMFQSSVPVVVFVYPAGAAASSAGVFVTLAGHIAAMSPGTSIGAAHPVGGGGENIEGDMRTKLENATVAMIRAIANERKRNADWAEKSVKESVAVTAADALTQGIIDIVADSYQSLLGQLNKRTVKLGTGAEIVLEDYSHLPQVRYEITLRNQILNAFSNPTIVAMLWVGASAGIGVEIYTPGVVLPGVIGLLCLVAALSVSQIIPITHFGVAFLVAGGGLLVLELMVPSGALAVGGVLAILLGATTLIDPSQAPGIEVSLVSLLPTILLLFCSLLTIGWKIRQSRRRPVTTGFESMVGRRGVLLDGTSQALRVLIDGENWRARMATETDSVLPGDSVIVVANDGNTIIIKRG
jgi:membrane-bound serine protease (ClpP class)